jgi:signal transduction histidine kinase
VQNLWANALRHTSPGGAITVEVVATGAGDGHVGIVVRDNGAGIEAQHLPHVFDRFYRADRSRSRHSGGAGLGLAIVRAIVEAHGGTVSAQSEGADRGSVFTVRLPAVAA